MDSLKPYPAIESRIIREGSMFGTLGTLSEKDERASADEEQAGHQTPNMAAYAVRPHPAQHQQASASGEQAPTLLSPPPTDPRRSISGMSYPSASPVSSQESNNLATPVTDPQSSSFEAQLKASPLFHDILDRLVRCEYASQEVQRELSDLSRKVNILIERTLVNSIKPEFKDPFAPSGSVQPRPSIGNIAPNQAAANDDTSSISQRLNMLTTSVEQLLALQTQQIQQNLVVHPESRNSVNSLITPHIEIAPNQILAPIGIPNNASILGHGLPNRPEIRSTSRQQNPNRNWSSELPVRPAVQELVRQEGSLRDKRRSSGLVRRDSASASSL